MKTHVYIYQTRIPKYREAFFLNLISLGAWDDIDYKIVVSEDREKVFRHESKMSDGVIRMRIKRIKILGRELHIHRKMNRHRGADLVICEYGLKNILVYYLLFLRRPKIFAFWGHGQITTRKTFKIENVVQQKLLFHADYFLAYTESCSHSLVTLGFPLARIQILNNSVDTNALRHTNLQSSEDTVPQILERFGLCKDDEIFLYIGSFDKDKRINFLLDAFDQLVIIKPSIALIICSQDDFEPSIRRNLPERVHLIGEADNNVKISLSRVCKAILNPGRVGLIAVDSFALELPIVTTKWNRHAPEFSYLENGVNSMVTQNDLDSFVQGCLKLLDDTLLRKQLVFGCRESAANYTVERMAANFHSGVLNCLDMYDAR